MGLFVICLLKKKKKTTLSGCLLPFTQPQTKFQAEKSYFLAPGNQIYKSSFRATLESSDTL